MDGRPPIHALVAWTFPNGEIRVRPQVVTLDRAADFARYGWAVLIDPSDESILARWIQLHRTPDQPRRRW